MHRFRRLAALITMAVASSAAVITFQPGPAAAAGVYWYEDWEAGPSTGAAGHANMSFVQAEDGGLANTGLNAVVAGPYAHTSSGYATEYVPKYDGDDFAKFATNVTAIDNGKPHSKVYKEWRFSGGAAKNDQWGNALQMAPASGTSIDGSYHAQFYFPASWTYGTRGWTNIFQFKLTEQSPFAQDPQWWVNVVGSSSTTVTLHMENWAGSGRSHATDITVPKSAWFQIRADVYENDQIDWYVDNVFWQTTHDWEQNIGRDFDLTGTPQTWVFGVGHYGGGHTDATKNTVFVDDAYLWID